MNIQGHWTWEKNGNFPPGWPSDEREGRGLHAMDDCVSPPSNGLKNSEEDWNSNKCTSCTQQKSYHKAASYSCKSNFSNEDNENKDILRKKGSSTANSPTSIFAASLHRKDISYDDLSKNIDANLAEIDMETFRSEDINSILALPAIYSGDFQSASHGEQCASVSGSLLNGLDLDSSIGPRNLEDEISISKDEPLFSPLREPPVPEGAISVDSLDNSSVYDNDLVLTCKANKNNYTIVFEGSGTQFSDDSEYQDVCGSSEGDNSLSSNPRQCKGHTQYYKGKCVCMVQSNLEYTTWSKLRQNHHGIKKRSDVIGNNSTKSRSLPNLSHHSVLITDKQLAQWANSQDIDLSQLCTNTNALRVAFTKDCSYSLSLLKLFMKHKIPSCSSIGSSSQSDSSSSLLVQPSNCINNSIHDSSNILFDNDSSQIENNVEKGFSPKNQCIKKLNDHKIDNDSIQTQLVIDNIKILDWNSNQNFAEANNNMINSLNITDNGSIQNNWKQPTLISDSDYDNSECFEDSLVEAPVPQLKIFHTMPIKEEEEEADISSGDEGIKDGHLLSDCKKTQIDTVSIQNNEVNCVPYSPRQDLTNNLDRINNIFPSCKSNTFIEKDPYLKDEDKMSFRKVEFSPEKHSVNTQTKQCNKNENFHGDEHPCTNTKSSGNQTEFDEFNTRNSVSRDSSPTSSGYVSSRHSSVERLRRSSQSTANPSNNSSSIMRKSNVVMAMTHTRSTQIPVHVKDTAMQTSAFRSSSCNLEFTLKDVDENVSEHEHILYGSSKASSQNSLESSRESQQKEKKSIYVCYPNYSLPDLSFLKSVVGEDSVFFAPSKYSLPQDVINTEKRSRPKSYAGFENLYEKNLSHIKDWESLSVLLPDDLKKLISQVHSKNGKNVGVSNKKLEHSHSCTISTTGISSESSSNSSDTNPRKTVPRSILRKSSSSGHCEDKQIHAYLPPRCSSAASIIDGRMTAAGKILHVERGAIVNNNQCLYNASSGDRPSGISTPLKKLQESECPKLKSTLIKCVPHDESGVKLQNPVSAKFPFSCMEMKASPTFEHYQLQHNDIGNNGKIIDSKMCCDIINPPACHCKVNKYAQPMNKKIFDIYSDCDIVQTHSSNNIQHMPYPPLKEKYQHFLEEENKFQADILQVKKGVKFCETSKMKKANGCLQRAQKLGTLDVHQVFSLTDEFCSNSKLCSNDCFDLDSENPPQEFAVSPTQCSALYSPSTSEFRFLQNSANGGSKLFHEALKKKTGLVENLQKATEVISEHCHVNNSKKSVPPGNIVCSTGQKILTCLCPAVHTILSDGLLPTVQGFFGPLPNSPWKVAEASVQHGELRKDIQELLTQVNSEKLLTDSTYRFNAFIIGLLNLRCLDWWISHLCTCQSLICHHYHPTALLSLLALPAAAHLRQELRELVSPLSNLVFHLDLSFETKPTAMECWLSENSLQKDDENFRQEFKPTSKTSIRNSNEKRLPEFAVRELDSKFHASNPFDMLVATKHNSNKVEEYQDQQLWPGITINPFPNAKLTEEFEAHETIPQTKSHKTPGVVSKSKSAGSVNAARGICFEKQRNKHDPKKLDIPEISLYSSTDSGCSSQAEHFQHVLVANNSSEGASIKESKGKDEQQFKKLRQKWEKITLGFDKQVSLKNSNLKQTPQKPQVNNQSRIKKKANDPIKPVQANCTTVHSRVSSEGMVATQSRKTVPQSSRRPLAVASAKAHEGKVQGSNAEISLHAANITRKSSPKSQIPLFKTGKNTQPKSMIPVHKGASKGRSTLH